MLLARQPIPEVLSDPATPENVRDRLAPVEEVRAFALTLGLEVGDQYTRYVAWPGDRIVTTLVRTRAGSLDAVPWRYPLLGSLPYRGYFDRDRAEAEAARLRDEQGFDVCVSGVAAYSTLGWLDDPVTGPMLMRGHATLVETLFHELVHATAFVPGHADFNESVARFLGAQATLRFFASAPPGPGRPADWPSIDEVRGRFEDRRAIDRTIADFRDAVTALEGAPHRHELRGELERSLRDRLATLPLTTLDAERVASHARLSDACLALRDTYTGDEERHAMVLEALGGDLPAMVARLRIWASEERPLESFYDVQGAPQAD